MCYIKGMRDDGDVLTYPVPVFSEQLLASVLEIDEELNIELLESAALSKAVKYDLKSCLGYYTKAHLLELAQDHGLNLPQSLLKGELIEKLSGAIERRFSQMMEYLPITNLEFLARFTETQPLVIESSATLKFKDISHIHNFGFLFLFKKGAHYVAVVPTQLIPMIEHLSKAKSWALANLHQRVDAYAVALSNLYGVLDIDQFAIVWNRYESDLLTAAMAQDILMELAKVQYYWWFDDELIISSFFKTGEEIETFLEKVKEVSYYVPTKEELVAYFLTPYDEELPSVNAMKEFLSGYRLPNDELIDDLMDEISDTCIVGVGMQDVFNLLNEYGLLFNGMDEINRFTELYVQMNENIRKWELRGHTPQNVKNIQNS